MASRSTAASRVRAASRLRHCERCSDAAIVSTPSTKRGPSRSSALAFRTSLSAVVAATSKLSSTRLSVVLTDCPPGPLDREKRQVSSASGTTTPLRTTSPVSMGPFNPTGGPAVPRSDVRSIVVTLGIVVLLVAVAIGGALSVLKARYDGRFRGARRVRRGAAVRETPGNAQAESPDRLTAADLDGELGERATLLQFSSAFCAPCRATRRVLSEVETMVEGVRHIELDAESHLDLVRRLDILRTPTVLVLDHTGAIVTRASGQPRKADVIAAVGTAVDSQTH
ncbi:MAG: hypothetical protein QOG10_1364 [Kribbellaceae bacterium]|nr:hypothetical protein [Kribbellaceae bacterium]